MAKTARVHLTGLKLTNFRNYSALRIDCDQKHLVFAGENGSGKTNILEAVSFLSPGRGLRRASYDEIARNGGDGTWAVFAEIDGTEGPVTIGTGIQETALGPDRQRKVRVNGVQSKTSEALLEHARIVWLTPAMDGLFTGPGSDRRKFLDRLVLAINPTHGRRVADYEKSMRARNRLLGEDAPDPAWLDAVEMQMSENGVAITLARLELVNLITGVIVRTSDPGSPFPDALLSLEGTLEALATDMPASDAEEEYSISLKRSRRLDAAARRTLEGPHRSDLMVTHRPKSMPAKLCSTGEQKALLLGIVLAHARLAADLSGQAPILLLDEVAAHLDPVRRSALFDRIEALNCQAWMTGTDRQFFDDLGSRANYWRVADGTADME